MKDCMDSTVDSQENNSTIEVEDTFGLEFAAVQWLNLVTNAEELFNKLLHSILLTGEEKEQIQRWLCLKQECEECVASDEATSFDGHPRHSLERIEELTEDTENTQDLSEGNGKTSDSQYESDSESDFDYQHPEFEDKLYGYMECFKDKVDILIRNKLRRDESVGDVGEVESVDRPASFPQHFVPPNAHQSGRRKSLHPGCLPVPINLNDITRKPESLEDTTGNEIIKEKKSSFKNDLLFLENAYSLDTVEPSKELKELSSKMESKKTQIKQLMIDLEGSHKKLEELQHTVEIKERFIRELIRNSDTRESAKVKFRKKYIKLEEEYYKIRSQIAHAEYAMHEKKQATDYDLVLRQKSEIDKFKNLAKQYEKRLKNIGMIIQIAGDSGKAVLELENSVLKSRKEIDKFKEHIEKEESRKEKLEQEIDEDKEKIKSLEENLQITKRDFEGEKAERLNSLQAVLDAGSTSTCEDSDNVEALRKEIIDLRNTKDCLLEQRRSLDEKYRKNKTLSSLEKRRILECDEGIEAIDATIEYKNEMMCGRKSLETLCLDTQELGEQMLMDRLLHLSPDEMRTLLHKYFRKVIDLKESGRKMEQQIYELEHENEDQAWRIQSLSQTLQTQRIEAEHQKVALQRSHQEKLHLMMKHFADESGSSGTEARGHLVLAKEDELSKVKRENKHLKRKLQEMEALMQAAAASRDVMRLRSRSASPDPLPLKQLPAPPSATSSTSKVTREKNKVIIRLNAPKKKSSKSFINFTQQK